MKGTNVTQSSVAVETRVQEYWHREGIPSLALARNPEGAPFRFTEGPPTANGKPHLGHLVARALKDSVLRHRRMQGYRVITSMAGWDCHGLPVEVEVEKSHGWRSKKNITEYGVDRFIAECRKSVFTYEETWRGMSRRMGYWLDYERPYFTMERSYVESVWWSLKRLYERGSLEKGRYVVPYCPRCETPEAAHEVAQGYKETQDPSVTIRLKAVPKDPASPPRFYLVWTTTPWTLPSNLALAVNPGMDYVVAQGNDGAEYVLVESALLRYRAAGAKPPSQGPPAPELGAIVGRMKGSELSGLGYEPPFPGVAPRTPERFRLYPAAFVSSEEGTGIVHVAPSFGVDDYGLGTEVNLGFFDPLDSSGHFTEGVPEVRGMGFKAADPKLTALLREGGVLWREERVLHTYPFCWRCNHALMYRALETWFVRTKRVREKLIANNATVTWIPAHLRDGRFGNFLSEGKDWALSRNRYWGTPLPIWNCPEGHALAVGSFAELSDLSGGTLAADFDPHKPFVDELALTCPQHHQRLVREPYVIDCWYDSGSAPFAQYHWPFDGAGTFDPTAPLDFLAEGLDQTRGWFYSLLVLATLLFDRPAYRNVIVNGMVLDEAGQKMSKSRGNVTDPLALMERMGADAPRLATYLGPYTEPLRMSETTVRMSGTRLLTTLLNVGEFYRSNRTADQFVPVEGAPHPAGTLDRWLLSRLEGLTERVGRAMDLMDPHTAAGEINVFIEEISVWYLRRSRPRFWREGKDPGKTDAYATLSFTLTTLAKLLAPLAPHAAEHVYQIATGTDYADGSKGVHLTDWPSLSGYRDTKLEEAMLRVMSLVETGRSLRMTAQVKSRIPLAELVVANMPVADLAVLGSALHELVADELNVKRLTLLTNEEFAVRQFPEEDWVLRATEDRMGLALSRTPNRELLLEGLSREIIRRIQMTRKEEKFQYTDRAALEIFLDPTLREAMDLHGTRILKECQVERVRYLEAWPPEDAEGLHRWDDVGGERLALRIVTAG